MSGLPQVGFLGGTGPQGRGLALRLALAGHVCVLGSRTGEKGEQAAAAAVAALDDAGHDGDVQRRIVGGENARAAESDIVLVVVPYEAQATVLPPLADALEGTTVVCCVNALGIDDRGPYPQRVTGGSAAEECQGLLPGSRVVGAFQTVSAVALRRVDRPLETDVLITGDDAAARGEVAALVRGIPGARAVDAGPLRLSAPIEDMTAVLLAVNRRYRAHSGLRLSGLDDAALDT